MPTFPIAQVLDLLGRASKGCPSPKEEDSDDGWTKSAADPMKLLAAFRSLRLKPGLVLRAYQFRAGGNGNGIIWALPKKAGFPSPDDCPKLTERFLEPPRPPDALDNLMAAIQGDDSPWSYLEASLFAREAAEFGAMWHGCNWGAHHVLGVSPWRLDGTKERSGWRPFASGKPKDWEWKLPRPRTWEPTVTMGRKKVLVRFHTFTGLGRERICRFTDSFEVGKYAFETVTEVVAEGQGGYIH